MERTQLALDVKDLEAAVEFYNTTFSTRPDTHLPGYAVYTMSDPPLRLVLIAAADSHSDHAPACNSVVNATNCCSVIHYESADHQGGPTGVGPESVMSPG